MEPAEMDRLIAARVAAQVRGDSASIAALHADDAEHDLVGAAHGPVRGRQAIQRFYEQHLLDVRTTDVVPIRRYTGEDFAVVEQRWRCRVPGSLLGRQGRAREIDFRALRIFEFRDGRISRENLWVDEVSILSQLT